jgi:hypothetical protein
MPEQSCVAVFAGYASEYPFRELAKRLRVSGVNVTELDMSCTNWRLSLSDIMSHSRRVLFSSQHPYMGAREYEHIYGIQDDILNLSCIIELTSPTASYFLPHDLVTPIKDHEIPALALMTGALMPHSSFAQLRDVVDVISVGWIGELAFSSAPSHNRRFKFSLLPSEMGYFLRKGLDHFLEFFGPLLALSPIVKLPRMKQSAHLSSELKRLGVTIVSPETPAEHVIACTNVVVSNGLSSILAEASYFGRIPICLIDGIHSESAQRHYLRATPTVLYFSPQQAAEYLLSMSDSFLARPISYQAFSTDTIISCLQTTGGHIQL